MLCITEGTVGTGKNNVLCMHRVPSLREAENSTGRFRLAAVRNISDKHAPLAKKGLGKGRKFAQFRRANSGGECRQISIYRKAISPGGRIGNVITMGLAPPPPLLPLVASVLGHPI